MTERLNRRIIPNVRCDYRFTNTKSSVRKCNVDDRFCLRKDTIRVRKCRALVRRDSVDPVGNTTRFVRWKSPIVPDKNTMENNRCRAPMHAHKGRLLFLRVREKCGFYQPCPVYVRNRGYRKHFIIRTWVPVVRRRRLNEKCK